MYLASLNTSNRSKESDAREEIIYTTTHFCYYLRFQMHNLTLKINEGQLIANSSCLLVPKQTSP